MPNVDNLKAEIMQKADYTPYNFPPGSIKMCHDVKDRYWWNGIKIDIADFVSKCLTCQKIKVKHQRPLEKLQEIPIPEWKWKMITMDFVNGLPCTTHEYDSIWVIVDRLTKSAHFLPIWTTYSITQYARLYVHEIVRLHGVFTSIISNRGLQFTF